MTTQKTELLTDAEAAKILHVSAGTLSVWRSTGRYRLPFVKIGRKVFYKRSDIDAWIEKRTRNQEYLTPPPTA
jgi:excisionase family DNA binding protein